MIKLYEVDYKNDWLHEGLVIKRGLKIADSLPIQTYNLEFISKQNQHSGRILIAESLEYVTKTLYFNATANKNTDCDRVLVHLPYNFLKTSGKIFAKSEYNTNIFVELKDGETLTIKIDTKEYYLMAISHYDINLKQILVVE